MPADHLTWLTSTCPAPDPQAVAAARDRQSVLTKPPGSLGRLESVAITVAGLQGVGRPKADDVAIVLFAADHGITAQGVSAFPASVTVEMLRNFAAGGAAIAVLARHLGASLTVVDIGTFAQTPVVGVRTEKVRLGTRDFSLDPALAESEVLATFHTADRVIADVRAARDMLILGEMGIGNTTAAAALAAALLGCPVAEVVGRGTGVDENGIARKTRVIEAALRRHGLDGRANDAMASVQAVGGLEIAALAGAMISAAHRRLPVLVDGFIVSVAALLAVKLNPSVRPWLIFSHVSAEAGHRRVLAALEAEPLLALELRLGEASGAAVALGVVRAALALHNEMATFAEAGVADGRG